MGPRVSRPKRMLVSDRFDFHQSGLVWHCSASVNGIALELEYESDDEDEPMPAWVGPFMQQLDQSFAATAAVAQSHVHAFAREILPPALDASKPELDWLQILGPVTFDLYFDFAWDTYDSTAWWARIERGAIVSVQQNNRLLGRTT